MVRWRLIGKPLEREIPSARLAIEPSVQLDPTFAYYRDRSPASIVSELRLAGYRTVRYFVTNEYRVDRTLVEAFQRENIQVWGTVIGNGTYSTEGYPSDWPNWQMGLLRSQNDGFYRFSPFCREYVEWKKRALAHVAADFGLVGIEIAEPFFPDWNGIDSGVYGDIGPRAAEAFRAWCGRDVPDFTDRQSPRYYLNDSNTYRLWVDFRVNAVNGFLHELVNGSGGIRAVNPRLQVATWSLGVAAGPGAVERVRQFHGLDAPAMIDVVRPDLHVIQTHWPDWMYARLAPDYIRAYRAFCEPIRRRHPHLPLGIQTDIGSQKRMRRDRHWIRHFAECARAEGYAQWFAYEYHIGLSMYEERPIPLEVRRIGRDGVELVFNKRVNDDSALAEDTFEVEPSGAGHPPYSITAIAVDGNIVRFMDGRFPRGRFTVTVRGLTDTPERWIVPGCTANRVPPGCTFTVPSWRGEE